LIASSIRKKHTKSTNLSNFPNKVQRYSWQIAFFVDLEEKPKGSKLVGGFNPSEKYWLKWVHLPEEGMKINNS